MKKPTDFPALLETFFTQRLVAQRRASPHTIISYRDTFRLLLQFAQKRLHKPPSQLAMEDLNAPFLGTFLNDLENNRANGARSRNLRLTAIRLRLSEFTDLRQSDVSLRSGAHVRCSGKGRKERCTPLAKPTVGVLAAWIKEQGKDDSKILFPSARGGPLSSDSVQYLVTKYAAMARKNCPSLSQKRVSPHVLRHTAAMELLQAGVDRALIALWLGHESVETTQIYLDADLALKEKVLAKTTPLKGKRGPYRPDDQLLGFLKNL